MKFAIQVSLVCIPDPLRNKVNTVLYAQKDVNEQRWTEQSWKAPVDVTVVNVVVPAAKPP